MAAPGRPEASLQSCPASSKLRVSVCGWQVMQSGPLSVATSIQPDGDGNGGRVSAELGVSPATSRAGNHCPMAQQQGKS